jgi:hypothetical protein
MMILVASSYAYKSIVPGDTDPVSERSGEFTDWAPFGLGSDFDGWLQCIDLIMPDLFSTFPGFQVGEVGATCDQEHGARLASKRACQADWVRKFL